MPKSRKPVGRSSRTPVKHYLLNAMIGKVCGVMSLDRPSVPCKITNSQPMIMVDLCGGDGLKTDDHDASPVIMYHHCAKLGEKGKRAQLEVIEKMPRTFEQLEQNCGYMSKDIATLTLGDSSEYRLPHLAETQAAFVHCDPNNVDQTPLSKPFVAGFNRFTTYLVTMGCNPAGLKRSSYEDREKWFGYVAMVVDVLPRHHDVVLFWLNRDEAKWAYLLSIPKVWAKDFTSQAVAYTSKQWTKGVSAVSFRDDFRGFNDRVAQLFLTKAEYENQNN